MVGIMHFISFSSPTVVVAAADPAWGPAAAAVVDVGGVAAAPGDKVDVGDVDDGGGGGGEVVAGLQHLVQHEAREEPGEWQILYKKHIAVCEAKKGGTANQISKIASGIHTKRNSNQQFLIGDLLKMFIQSEAFSLKTL